MGVGLSLQAQQRSILEKNNWKRRWFRGLSVQSCHSALFSPHWLFLPIRTVSNRPRVVVTEFTKNITDQWLEETWQKNKVYFSMKLIVRILLISLSCTYKQLLLLPVNIITLNHFIKWLIRQVWSMTVHFYFCLFPVLFELCWVELENSHFENNNKKIISHIIWTLLLIYEF